MGKKEETTSQEVYGTILNGRVDLEHDAKNPLARREIRYYNPKGIDKKTGERGVMQSQNYLEMQDVIVPVIVRENNGVLEFAMQYESIPAINKVTLELPDCPFFDTKHGQYTDEEVEQVLHERMQSLGLSMQVYSYLDSGETAVSQSFTDQQAKFVKVFVEQVEDNPELQWFPITSLESYLNTIGENSSLQTKYALQLFYNQYKEQLSKKQPTSLEFDTSVVGQEGGWIDKKNIMEHKYRFGIELADKESELENENSQIPNFGTTAEYGLSKDSAQCLVIRKSANGIKIGLSKQQRSPFIERDGVDEYFYEAAAGMREFKKDEEGNVTEELESLEETAIREAAEETGVDKKKGKLIHIAPPTILSKTTQEYSDFYLFEMDGDVFTKQSLDEQENIDEIEWFDLDTIDLSSLHAPLPTKFLIAKAREFYERERERERERKKEQEKKRREQGQNNQER